MTAQRRAGPVALFLAAVGLYLLLVLPSHPNALTLSALASLPLELPVVLLGLAALGPGLAGQAARLAVTAGLGLVTVLKVADLAMFSALSRGFNPVADLPLIEAGLRLVSGSIGTVPAVLVLAGALLATGGVVFGLWWATGVWTRAALPRGALRGLAAAGAIGFAGMSLADVARAKGWTDGFDPPGSAFTARTGLDRVQQVRDTLADLETFRRAARSDPFAGATGLLDRIDRDVIVVFVESYGRTSHDTPFYADRHRDTLARAEVRLAARGLAMASGYLGSPTQGGQSWLAHATFANGLWINDQIRYRAALVSGRQTLFHIAAQSGFDTAAVMPQITLEWPESAFMGFGTVLAARDLGYAGLPFNWVTMPDQFTFAAMDRLLRDTPSTRPRFIQMATGTSHAPWVPVPRLVPWDQIGDGRIFNPMAEAGDPPDVVWRDHDRVRAQYRDAIDYALQTVMAYAERHAEDPPLMIILGDHQAAGFVALDERREVPVHVIGPPDLVARAAAFAPMPGLLPPAQTPALPMDQMRDSVLRAYSSGLGAGGN
ncbi:MAG: sulfatase-like hydrolase/transferase [Cypionkella sp.]|nr:sulfatase-like hydrolase/transferase [Cypionkella sp.]